MSSFSNFIHTVITSFMSALRVTSEQDWNPGGSITAGGDHYELQTQ